MPSFSVVASVCIACGIDVPSQQQLIQVSLSTVNSRLKMLGWIATHRNKCVIMYYAILGLNIPP